MHHLEEFRTEGATKSLIVKDLQLLTSWKFYLKKLNKTFETKVIFLSFKFYAG